MRIFPSLLTSVNGILSLTWNSMRRNWRKSLKSSYLKRLHFNYVPKHPVLGLSQSTKSKLYSCGFFGGFCGLTSEHLFFYSWCFRKSPVKTKRSVDRIDVTFVLTNAINRKCQTSVLLKCETHSLIPFFIPLFWPENYKINSGASVKRYYAVCNKFVYLSG